MSEPDTAGLRLLSLDGGGIRGLSSLLILQAIMHRMKTEDSQADLRPCDYFDLIGGTSTGGIIALMLGRLRMSVEEAIACYDNLAGKVFSKSKKYGDGKYSATLLEEVIKETVKERTGDSDAQVLDDGTLGGICKTFVCAMNAHNMNARKPVLFRTYESPKEPSIPCTVWQAARATSAAPTFFKRVLIGPPMRAEPYIDGGVGRNNPIMQVLEEAEVIFPERRIACVISIGTGKPGTIDVPNPGFLERNLVPIGVIKAMVAMATDCEETAQQMEKRFENWPKTYFRFNVEQGLQKVKLGDWDRMGEVSAHTRNYMSMHEVDQRLDTVIEVITERKGGMHTSATNAISNQLPLLPVNADINTSKMRKVLERLRPSKKADYKTVLEEHGLQREVCTPDTRVKILRDIAEWANDHSLDSPRVFWLTGQAGSGKTTIAYTIAKRFGKGDPDEDATLGGNFFCSRQFQETQYQTRIIPTIAYQLARKCKVYADTLCAADKFDAVDHDVATQLQDLLIGPWRKSNVALSPDVHPYLVVIDALDEIKDSVGLSLESGRMSFLRILLNAIDNYDLKGFKFLVTSRPDPDIAGLCESFTSKTVCRLQDVPIQEAKADVETYLNVQLPTLTGSPELAKVGHEAGGLFIYAATVVRYLTPHRSITTKERTRMLNDLLSKSSSAGNATSLIDSLYRQIMLDAFSNFAGDSLTTRLRILYTYLCAAERISSSIVAELVADGDDEAAKAVLDTLHAVLYVQDDQVFWYHASFPDFIFDESRSNFGQNEESFAFYSCNAPIHQSLLGQSCFRVMMSDLRFNIANITSSFILDRDNPELPGAVKRNITPVLSYSCRNWDYHVSTSISTQLDNIRSTLSEFLQLRVLFWMEVMNLLGLRGQCERMLRMAHKWVKKGDPMLGRAFAEAAFFALYFSGSEASCSTPHLYISALATWPQNDGIVRRWRSHFPGIPTFTNTLSTTGVTLMTLKMTQPVNTIAVSSDGMFIVSGSRDKCVRIWDASTGEIRKALLGHTSYVTAVAFSNDGMYVVSGSGDTSVRIWNVSTGVIHNVFEGHTSSITSVAFSRDGSSIVSASHDKSARIWDTSSGEMLKALEGHTSAVSSVAFSNDGRYIVSGSGDKTIRIWDVSTGEVLKVLGGHTEYITSVAFSSDDMHIVSCSYDMSVRIWTTSTGEIQKVLEGHTKAVESVAFSNDGMYIVSGSHDNSVRIWNARTGEMQMVLVGHTLNVTSVAYSSDDRYIVSGSWDKSVRIWGASVDDNGEMQAAVMHSEGHTSYVTSVAFSTNGIHIVSGSWDNSVRIWNASTGEMQRILEGHTSGVTSVQFSSNGKLVVSGSKDKTVRIWDVLTGKIHNVLKGHTKTVESVAFSSDGILIASGSRDRSVRVWETSKGEMLQVFEGHTRPVETVAFSKDGIHIASGSDDHCIRIWDVSTGKTKKVLRHGMPVQSVAFSSDGTHIVSGSRDSSVWIWDASTGDMLKELKGHTSYVKSVAFSSDDMLIVSGSGDKSVRIWDASTGEMQQVLEGHSMPVESVAFSSDDMYIVSGSDENLVRVWTLSTHQASGSYFVRQKTDEESSGQYEHTGWLVSPKTQHYLMFIPLSANFPDPSNILTLPTSRAPSVDLNVSTLGSEWHRCFSPYITLSTI